ncbi:MAG: hypothetical protein P8Y45_04810 [Exilibacterium sp.]
MKVNTVIQAFNRGRISRLALARTDLDRTKLSSEVHTNIIPRTLGSATIRPGWEYTGARKSNNQSISIPFIFASDDLAEIELTDSVMRVWVDDALITRPAVTAAVTNGSFDSDVASWNDTDESGAASTWLTGGYLALLGTGTNAAKRNQQITVNEASTVHALRIVIERGPVTVKIGTSAGDDTYHSASLKTGTHSLAFTPTGDFYIEFSSTLKYTVLVDSVSVESSGNLELPTPWATADLPNIRWDQSADVIFISCKNYQQRRVERRNNDSWSVVLYEPEDGPFGLINVSATSITPSAITGDITLTANKAYWKSTMVGELYKLTSAGQNVTASATAEDTFTNSIFVTGIDTSRAFSISITNTFSATVTLQRSTDDATWEDVTTYTAVTATTYNDALDNLQYYYRIGVKTGDYTSGTADLQLSYAGGSLTGIAKVVGYTSTTVVDAVVLVDLGAAEATTNWYRSQWSDNQGWPTALAFYEGRLWHAGKGGIWGSVSDGFESFDDDVVGDSGPINRTFGSGPVDVISWLLPLQRLLIGTTLSEISARSTSFDEPLTPTNFNTKDADAQGSYAIPPIKNGKVGLFVQRCGNKLYQLQYGLEENDYDAVDLSELIPEIGKPYITRIAIQQQPDTRIHCVKSDGTVALLVKDDAENTLAWLDVETNGFVEDVYIFPGQAGEAEDIVYHTVKRTINGSTVRYREKWAFEENAEGGTSNKIADSFLYYSGAATTTITGLGHLEGETVIVWGNGKYLGTKTVSSSQITGLSEAVTTACVGLGYTWQWKSVKLAYAAQMGTALLQPKRVNQLGLIAQNIHMDGIQYGNSFDTLWDLPRVKNGQIVPADTVHETFDEETFPFDGTWSTDSRVCLQGSAPYPCTLLGLVISMETVDKD